MSSERSNSPAPARTEGAAEHAGEDPAAAAGPASGPRQATIAFLQGKGALTPTVLAGLHQALLDANLVGRVTSAARRGARLAASLEVKGRSPRELVQDPGFDWGGGAGAAAHADGEAGGADAAGPVQRKADGGGDGASAGAAGALERASHDSGFAPDAAVRQRVEQVTGADLGGARVHTGPASEAAAASVQAHAYTVGSDVHFAAGQYQPGSSAGDHLLAHELVHTVQQQGAPPTTQHKLEVSQPGDAAEHEADAIADAALATTPSREASPSRPVMRPESQVARKVQRTVNGPYPGNRPNPTAGASAGLRIQSSADRVMQVGQSVTYTAVLTNPTLPAGDRTVSWSATNNPAAVAAGVPAVFVGPSNSLTFRARASVAGIHTINAAVSVNGHLHTTLHYQQQVVAASWSYAVVPRGTARSPLATIADFIALCDRVERAYGGVPWQDVVTKMRKEDYPGPPGGFYSGVVASFTFDDAIDEQENMPGLASPPVAIGDIAALRATQEVTGPTGEQIDIGHVLTGLDSMNFPGVAGLFSRLEGPAGVTWSGDVGSAMVRFVHDARPPYTDAQRVTYYNRLANTADMMGDYDGVAIGNPRSLNVPPGAGIAARLRAYYTTGQATGVARRFHNFCRASGFALAGNQLASSNRARIRAEILNFAHASDISGSVLDSFSAAGDEGMGGGSMPIREMTDREADWFTDHFIAEVNAGLTAEGP